MIARVLAASFLTALSCSFDVDKEGVTPAECSDDLDNDVNGLIDCEDPACSDICGGDADADTDTDTDTDTDADTDTDTDPPPSCDDQYGAAPAYVACVEDAARCAFSVQTEGTRSCAQVCRFLGGECLATHDNDEPCNDVGNDQTCDFTGFNSSLCECTRGCGGGPACAGGETCTGGSCN